MKAILYVLQVLLLMLVVSGLYHILPSSTPNSPFNSTLAMDHLHKLTKLGPRVTGSKANEYEAVATLKSLLKPIMEDASNLNHIELDVQIADDTFTVGKTTHIFKQLQNVVVKISNKKSNNASSVLINSHFDSVPLSPGASDDGINAAIMIELTRCLANIELDRNVILLFNGAEETGLAASYAFVKQHKWFEQVKVFVNLEAAGAGGRELLFQAGHPDLIDVYVKHAAHPSASVVAQEVFQNGLIPSDTDYRIFRDHGHVYGLDLAFVRNGYVYHTQYDDNSRVPLGSVERMGANVLAMVEHLADADTSLPEVSEESDEETPVFFEVLGHLNLSYNFVLAIIINCCSIVLVLTVTVLDVKEAAKKTDNSHIRLILTLGALVIIDILILVTCLIFVFGQALLLKLCNATMAWYSRDWFLIPMYSLPMVAVSWALYYVGVQLAAPKTLRNSQCLQLTQLCLDAHLLLLALLTALLTVLGIRSSYLVVALMLFSLLASLSERLLRKFSKKWISEVFDWLPLLNPLRFLPLLMLLYLANVFFGFFVPVSGRQGALKNPEITLGIFVILITFLALGLNKHVIASTRRSVIIAQCLIMSFIWAILLLLIISFPEFGFPYSDDSKNSVKPYRIHLYHTRRSLIVDNELIERDEGIALHYLSFNTPLALEKSVPRFADRKSFDNEEKFSECKTYVGCGVPFYRPTLTTGLKGWIDFPHAPKIPKAREVQLQLFNRTQYYNKDVKRVERLFFLLEGPSSMDMYLVASANLGLESWSFAVAGLDSSSEWLGNKAHYVHFQRGLDGHLGHNQHFYIDLVHNKEEDNESDSVVLAISGHFQYDEYRQQDQFDKFVKEFPKWVFPWAWTTDLKQYQFNL